MADDQGPRLENRKYFWMKAQLEIDLLNADEELSKIPALIQDAAEMTAVANEIRDAAKEELTVITARVAASLRIVPKSDGKLPSESSVDKDVVIHSDVIRQQEVYAEARLDAALWASMTEGLRSKNGALRASADLISVGYLSQSYILDKRREGMRRAPVTRPTQG